MSLSTIDSIESEIDDIECYSAAMTIQRISILIKTTREDITPTNTTQRNHHSHGQPDVLLC